MNLMSWIMITISITLSTSLITSTTHWLMTWVCLEINTLSMTPIISKPHHPRATEAATKYYLMQILASTALLFATTMNAMNTSNWEMHLITDPMSTTIITMTLLMKMAAAPFHFWLPEVSQGTTTLTTLTILTWQKIAPLMILLINYNKMSSPLLISSAILSILIGGLGGLNQLQLRKIMAFSSIAHTGWILAILIMAPNISTLSFMIYTMTSIPVLMTISLTSSITMKDMGMMWTTSPYLTVTMTTTILSLAGLPPLMGFMPKWLILNKMVSGGMIMEATTMTIASMLTLYIYMRMIYMSSMTAPPHTSSMPMKWRTPNKKYIMLISALTMMITFLLPMMPSL
uniref:NADH dehydrogenase subunit 2 n=1 Tax=Plagiopholis styani TaxID=527806 RepID=UPI001BEEF9B0|nr:NADH dehydrogenase subunit 2 [Plagiopholis styani]QTZ98238.1 NADH dehydrogenase subunit 2 [Plagiopholis styani]